MPNDFKITVNDKSYSVLSWTTDMACFSFSLPALDSCPMKYMEGDNAICSGCYAAINRYNMPNVLESQWARFSWTKYCIAHDQNQFIDKMIHCISKQVKNNRFRGHDSGDFFHPVYINMWTTVCKSLPTIKFWFPTRSWRAENKTWNDAFEELTKLPNVMVRPSALNYNDESPKWKYSKLGSTVVTEDIAADQLGYKLCPKTKNGGSCETNNCYSCWEKNENIAYLVHGRAGQSKPTKISDKELGHKINMKNKFATVTINGK